MKAKLITLHHSQDMRILKEITGSNSRYFCGPRESSMEVEVIPATDEILQKELTKLSIIISDMPTVKKVALKFREELCQLKDGELVWDSCTHKGFYQIIK